MPNGGEFPLSSPWFILQEDGLGMPPIEYATQRGPFQHGESVRSVFLRPRTIQLVIRRNGCSRSEYLAIRRSLLEAVMPLQTGVLASTRLRKYLADGSIREFDVYASEGPGFPSHDPETWDEWSIQDTVRFTAFDPVARDPTQHSLTFVATGSVGAFPITFPLEIAAFAPATSISYAGDWASFPTITITGPVTGLLIRNLTIDEQLQFNNTIGAGRIVTVDLSFGAKTVTLDDGTNLVGFISSDSDLGTFRFVPGTNLIQIYASGTNATTSVRFAWYDRYVGF